MEIARVKVRKERGSVVKQRMEVNTSLLLSRILRDSHTIFSGEMKKLHNNASNILCFGFLHFSDLSL